MKGFIGLDFATQSARAIIIGEDGRILTRFTTDLEPVKIVDKSRTQNPESWVKALNFLLKNLAQYCDTNQVEPTALAITATSGTFLLTDNKNTALTPGVMYNDGTASTPLERAALFELTDSYFKHVPEYLISYLSGGKAIAADWSHSLKTGFNLDSKSWEVDTKLKLPTVVAPGTQLGEIADNFPLAGVKIYAGMTDGCTGQISAGGAQNGSAVTTIGTTLVLKIISDKNISGPGFYSHLLPSQTWLAGGASNLGGISLSKFGDLDKLNNLAKNFGPANRVVYPLEGIGERFPIADSEFKQIASAPASGTIEEFRSILEGIAFAERLAYETLVKSGAPKLTALTTVGGGSKSKLWSEIRAGVLNLDVVNRSEAGSDLGAAMIALASASDGDLSVELQKIPLQSGEVFRPNLEEQSKLNENYFKFLELIHHSHKYQ